MKFLKSLFIKKQTIINTYDDFWEWFTFNEKKFFRVVKYKGPINRILFHPLSENLNQIKAGFYFLVGMCEDDKAELIITVDGVVKNLVFAEELVKAAPKIMHWKITALKQPQDIKNVQIEMEKFVFDQNTIAFYPNTHKDMPDEIDITLTHQNFSEEHKSIINNGTFLALDYYLGEVNSVTSIDNINIINPVQAKEKTIPFERLKSYLVWREKECIEKFENLRWNSDNDKYSTLEAMLKNGMPLIATINKAVLDWDYKASHPWMAEIEIHYDGNNNNGLPDKPTYDKMANIEKKINDNLKLKDGYICIGRETADSLRLVYYACVEFRIPSKVLHEVSAFCPENLKFEYNIFKDKYWQCLKRFK